jgi:glycosyltransferase involved in cell wall biosynthesis
MTGPRHIGINAVFLRPPMGGVETYVRRIVGELVALRPDVRFTVFASAPGARALAGEAWADEVELVTHPALGVRYLGAASEVAVLPRLARRRGVDLLHSVALTGPLHPRGFAHVLTIGDLIWMHEPAAVEPLTRWTWRALVPRVARRADRVLTYSESSRRDVVELLGVPAERIDAVPLGPGTEPGTATLEPAVRERYGLGDRPVVLTVSIKRPSKNLGVLVEAMASLPQAVLVMPGRPNAHDAELQALAARLGVSERVRFPGHVSAEDLEGLYGSATCFAFPSRYEGFGLPVLEAMRRGVPVACARASSLPEVAGDAALYFDPRRPDEVAGALGSLLADPAQAARLGAAGRARAARFSWRATAERTLQSYERAWAHRAQ